MSKGLFGFFVFGLCLCDFKGSEFGLMALPIAYIVAQEKPSQGKEKQDARDGEDEV